MIPPDESTEFVYHMENRLSLYQELYDSDRPVVCFHEHPTQLVKQVFKSQSAEPGRVEREEYQYKPQGTKTLFFPSEPLDGWREVTVTDRRTTEDWVSFMQQLVEEHYPDVDCLHVVLDTLNTHNLAAVDDYLPPDEARRLLDTLEFASTPVHGSWLNMAEIEINRLKGQCLDRRLAEEETLGRTYTPGSMTEPPTSPISTGDSHPVAHGTNSNNYTLHFRVDTILLVRQVSIDRLDRLSFSPVELKRCGDFQKRRARYTVQM